MPAAGATQALRLFNSPLFAIIWREEKDRHPWLPVLIQNDR
jgi:hypothetical protein